MNIRSGSNQNDASKYSVLILYEEYTVEQPNKQPNAQADIVPEETANEHNKTKLELLFNYIIYNKPNFEKISKEERKGIINILRKLDIFIDNTDILQYFSESQVFEYQLQYWAIKEIFFSPYKVFLGKLTRQQFVYRFFKAKKYMDIEKCSIYEFLAYFIRCIQEEMEEGGNINDRKN